MILSRFSVLPGVRQGRLLASVIVAGLLSTMGVAADPTDKAGAMGSAKKDVLPTVPDIQSIKAAAEMPPVLPYWTFGHWIWEDARNTRAAVEELTEAYLSRQIPVRAVIIDSPWAQTFNDFIPNSEIYPDLPGLVQNMHSRGIRVLFFYTGALNSSSYQTNHGPCPTYDFALKNEFVINGGRESKWFKGPAIHVDFTNPDACAWWHTQLDKLHALGADGAKVDFAHNWFGATVSTSRGLMSNRDFGYAYYKDNFNYNSTKNPDFVTMTYGWSNRGLIGFPGVTHINWVGDFKGDWVGMKDQLKNIYLSAQDGFSGVGCEIGGYWKVPSDKTQFIRYTQLSCFMPIMINGGSLGAFEHHLPWKHDEDTVEIYRSFVLLHEGLSPYLFSCGVDAHLGRRTIIRDHSFIDESHLLGDQLFVKAITSDNVVTSISLPPSSQWIDFWDDTRLYRGGTNFAEQFPLSRYPVFIRAGGVLPVGGKETVLRIYPSGRTSYTYHKALGSGAAYETITLTIDEVAGLILIDAPREQTLVLAVKSFAAPKSVRGAKAWSFDPSSRMIRIETVVTGKTEIRIDGLQGYSTLELGP